MWNLSYSPQIGSPIPFNMILSYLGFTGKYFDFKLEIKERYFTMQTNSARQFLYILPCEAQVFFAKDVDLAFKEDVSEDHREHEHMTVMLNCLQCTLW